MIENNIKILSDIQHVLQRPATYIGSMSYETFEGFIFNKDIQKFEYKQYQKIQAFEKIINEILDNSVDEALRTNFEYANLIEINVENNNKIIIKDNGRGVPISNIIDDKGKKVSQLEAAFTKARAGSNFSNERSTIGVNGLGSFCVSVFSKYFEVNVKSKEGTGNLICKDNLSIHKCKINLHKTSGKTYTEVSFTPDYEKFGLKEFDKNHQDLLYTRLINLSICYPKIKFKFNNILLPKLKSELYLSYFGDNFEQIKDNKYIVGILPNNTDNFIQSSYIDGLNIKEGGNHIDYLLGEIISRLREHRIFKKYNVTPGDIKNKIKLICILRDFPNMQFNSQTKEKLTNSISEIREYFKDIDFNKFINILTKNEYIIDPIIINYKIKEQVKEQLALKNSTKIERNFKCDKYLPATKIKKNFIITEGDSASGGLCPSLGREENSFFSTRGVPLNAYIAKGKDIANNEELTNIIKALNLDISNNNKQILSHQYIILASDADADGSHIQGLYLGFFYKYAKWLLDNKLIKYLKTPIAAIVENKKIKKYWFTLKEMNEYLSKNKIKSNQTLKYYKGLGSFRSETLKELIQLGGGIDNFLEDMLLDEQTNSIIDNWVGEKQENVQSRKEYLKNYRLDINRV